MNCVVLLEDCMGFVEGETGSCRDTCVTGGVGGAGEGSVQVEQTVAVRGDIPEAVKVPSIKTGHEVRLMGVRDVVSAIVMKRRCLKFHLIISCFVS
jgi:hypothetical protein